MGLMDGAESMVDAELVVQFKAGEEGAFDTLVRRYMKDAYLFSLRLTGNPEEAEEISQEGFVSAYRGLRRFRGESSFRSWLFRILINLNRDRLRSRKRYEARIVRAQAQADRPNQEIGVEKQASELSDVVRTKVDALPDRQREVLLLHLYEDLNYREIATTLGITYESVKVNLSLARKRLKEDLKEHI